MALLSSLPFYSYAVIHAVCFAIMAKRVSTASQENHLTTWKTCHWLLLVGLGFVILDCVRLGLGGSWEDTTLEDPPALAGLYGWAVITHLLLVPYFIFYQAELIIATKWRTTEAEGKELEDTPSEVWLRRISVLVSTLLSVALAFNLYAEFGAYLEEGYTRKQEYGIVKYKWPSTERAAELGYIVFLPDLAGVISFALSAVIAGGVIWCRTGYPWYFVTAFIGLMGQAAGPALPPWFFFFTSNLFEIFSFAGQVMVGGYLFNRQKKAGELELWQGS